MKEIDMKKLLILFMAIYSAPAWSAEMKELYNCNRVSGLHDVSAADDFYQSYLLSETDLEGAIDAYLPNCKGQMNATTQTGGAFNEYIRTQQKLYSDLEKTKLAEDEFKWSGAKANKILKHFKEKNCSTQIDRYLERVNVEMKENRERIASCKPSSQGSANLQPSNSVKPTNCVHMPSLTGSGHPSSCQCPSGMAYIELTGICTYNR